MLLSMLNYAPVYFPLFELIPPFIAQMFWFCAATGNHKARIPFKYPMKDVNSSLCFHCLSNCYNVNEVASKWFMMLFENHVSILHQPRFLLLNVGLWKHQSTRRYGLVHHLIIRPSLFNFLKIWSPPANEPPFPVAWWWLADINLSPLTKCLQQLLLPVIIYYSLPVLF